MSPPTTLENELAEEERVLRVEQEWFLTTQVKPSLQAIQKSLLACQEAVRLQDDAKGALTLAVSSANNDTLKGFVTLAGSFIVKGELTIKLPKLPVIKTAIHSNVPSNASVPASSTTATVGTGAVPTFIAAGAASISASTAVSTTASSSASSTAGNTENTAEEKTPTAIPATAPAAGEGSEQAKGDTVQPAIQDSNQVLQQALGALPRHEVSSVSGSTVASGAATPVLQATAALPGQTALGSLLAAAAILQPPLGVNQLALSHRTPGHVTQPYLLEQLKDVQNHTARAIYRLEDYWIARAGDGLDVLNQGKKQQHRRGEDSKEGSPSTTVAPTLAAADESAMVDVKDATRPLKTLLELMQRHLRAAIEAMARPNKEKLYPFRVCDPKIFSPVLSEDFVIEFYIRDSQLVCAAYALQLTGGSSTSGASSLTTYLQQALPGAPAAPSHPPTTMQQHTQQHVQSIPLSTVPSAVSGSDGHHQAPSHTPQQPQHSGPSTSHPGGSSSGTGDHGQGAKSGSATPRPPSPLAHHHTMSSQPTHQAQLQPQQQPSQLHQQGGKAYPWPPSKSPPTPQHPHHPGSEYHASSSVVAGPPPNEAVVLPVSNKIGQTSKGGINKYRGKVATTLEDKVVQVESPKLAEISARLAHAEGLCRRLLQFLVLQESVTATPI